MEDGLIQILEESNTMDSLQVLAILFSARNQSDRAQAMLQEVLRRRPDAEAWLQVVSQGRRFATVRFSSVSTKPLACHDAQPYVRGDHLPAPLRFAAQRFRGPST